MTAFPETDTLASISEDGSTWLISFEGVRIPIRYWRGAGRRLVVLFHGAVSREKRAVPFFQRAPQLQGAVHLLSISDPTLLMSETIPCSWYCGTPEVDVASVIGRFVRSFQTHVGASGTIYVGSSSGGFAALNISHDDPGSLALVANPQTNLGRHYPNPVRKYHAAFWSHLDFKDFVALPRFNAPRKYAEAYENTVIYLQSQGDEFHLKNHFARFYKSLPHYDRLVLEVGYWGVMGHGGSVPFHSGVLPWLKAAVEAENFSREALIEGAWAERSAAAPRAPSAPRDRGEWAAAPADLRLADRLREWTLNGS